MRGVRLRLAGTCSAAVQVPESRLRLALQYLITTTIEAQQVGGKVVFLLSEGPGGALLRGEGERGFRDPGIREMDVCEMERRAATATPPPKRDAATATPASVSTLRRMRMAIASRVLETAGVSLVFGDGDVGPAGFVLRIPRRVGTTA